MNPFLMLPVVIGAAQLPRAPEIIAARCLSCHDSVKKTGGIDLSTRAAGLAARAFLPNRPDRSRMIRMVAAGKMPPTGRLPDSDVLALREWIRAGAPYPAEPLKAVNPAMAPLWSMQPIKRAGIPRTPFDSLAKNPIDRFIFAKLAEKKLSPSPPASKLALIRRVTIDLTGLPPTPEEVSAFLADSSPNAYEKVVDRLLASPAYGERWGRHWLDVVRFGESNGYEQNHLRPNAWPYRDYVIRSLNEDKPYNQFVMEQLAGDAIAKGNPDIEVATGFMVAGVHDTVGIQEEQGTRQQRINDLEDIVSTTGAAFLGLTVGCARCHDHKFDPIPQRDFYRLAACFAGVRHGDRRVAPLTDSEQQRLTALAREIGETTNQINELESLAREIVLRRRGIPASARPAVNARRNVDDFQPVTARFVRFTVLATRDGTEPCIDELQVFGIDGKTNLALASGGGKATASSLFPNAAIHQIHHLNDGKFGNDWSWISGARGTGWAQIELPGPEVVSRVVWSRDGGEIPRFDDRLPVQYRIEVSVDGQTWQTVSTESGRASMNDYVHPDELNKAMTAEQRESRDRLKAQLGLHKEESERIQSARMAYAGQFTAPDPTYVLRRGDVMQRLDEVTPGALSRLVALPPELIPSAPQAPTASRNQILRFAQNDRRAPGASQVLLQSNPQSAIPKPQSEEPARRLALARWITDPRNPLTPRVIVNRIWQHHFGRGIVGTPSDFGRNGEPPTHPELLDWLAGDFMVNGWRLKRLHKTIVMSYVYRQASSVPRTLNPKPYALDPASIDAGNLLLWRMPLRRMEAEAIRDAILATSGKLDRRLGGPSYPLYNYKVVNVAIYEPLGEYGPETWRRSVYSQAARAIREDLLGAFDCPECSQRAPKRDQTTTALQALSLMNGPFSNQQARFLAERITKEGDANPVAQVNRAFQLSFGRPGRRAEIKSAVDLVKYRGLLVLCCVLMNANEFLYY